MKHEVRWSTSKSIFDDLYALDDDEKKDEFRSTTIAKKNGKK